MFLKSEARDIARRKQACVLRNELNRRTLEIELHQRWRGKCLAARAGFQVFEALYAFWQNHRSKQTK